MYLPKKVHNWGNVIFNKNWFKTAIKYSRSQMYRIKKNKCGREFKRIGHPSLREYLFDEYKRAVELDRMERELAMEEEERDTDDEIDMTAKEEKVFAGRKKRGGLMVRKTSMGKVKVVGGAEGGEDIKLLNLNTFQLADKHKQHAEEEDEYMEAGGGLEGSGGGGSPGSLRKVSKATGGGTMRRDAKWDSDHASFVFSTAYLTPYGTADAHTHLDGHDQRPQARF